MGEHHWKDNRRYAKADVYAVADLIREYQLSFAVVSLLRTLCELGDYREEVFVGNVAELHDLTRLSRKTITNYLNELCEKQLITREPSPVGSRQLHLDVSTAYKRLIVPNEETPRSRGKKAAKGQQLEPASNPTASRVRQMTHSTWENTAFGGSEAARREGSEATTCSSQRLQEEEWSSHPEQLFNQITQKWSSARSHLERELRKLDLDPAADWCNASFTSGNDRQVVEGFMAVVEGFSDF